MVILLHISPANGDDNPKAWPVSHVEALMNLAPEHDYRIVGAEGSAILQNPKITAVKGTRKELLDYIDKNVDLVIAIDSWIQHLVALNTSKPMIVLFSRSNPEIFGHKRSGVINLFESEDYFRSEPFYSWIGERVMPEALVSPEQVARSIGLLKRRSK